MAEGALGTYSTEQVERLLQCAICLDRFNSPKILPCQHTFCKAPCLEQLIDQVARTIKCPECRAEHYVPRSGADGFPTNITISGFLDLPTQQTSEGSGTDSEEAVSAGSTSKCGVCENEATTIKCFHCNKMVCESCKRSHTGQLKIDVGRLINQIRRGVPKISNAISEVEQRSEQVKQQAEAVKSEISDTVERYLKEMKDRDTLLRSELEAFLQGEMRSLRLHQENLEVELASISSYCDSTESLLNQTDNNIPEADMANMRRQCGEYMDQIRQAESVNLPDSRRVNFRFNGQPLHSSITSFGELSVSNPSTGESGERPPDPGSQADSRNSNPSRSRWTDVHPIDVAMFDTMPTAPTPVVSQRSISPPQLRSQHYPSTHYQRPSRSSIELRQSPGNHRLGPHGRPPISRVNPAMFRRDRNAPSAGNPFATTRDLNRQAQNYMFRMDTPAETTLAIMEQMRREEERERANNAAASSIQERQSQRQERIAGVMGGGGGGGGGSAAVTGGGTGTATGTPPRVHAPRQAESFEVPLHGEASRPPNRGQGHRLGGRERVAPGGRQRRGDHTPRRQEGTANANSSTDANTPQRTASDDDNNTTSVTNNAGDTTVADVQNSDNGTGPTTVTTGSDDGHTQRTVSRDPTATVPERSSDAADNAQQTGENSSSPNDVSSSSSATVQHAVAAEAADGSNSPPGQLVNSNNNAGGVTAPSSDVAGDPAPAALPPPPLTRARTFVQENGPTSPSRNLPVVSNQSVSFDVSLDVSLGDLITNDDDGDTTTISTSDSLTVTRPIINYTSKGVLQSKIGQGRGNREGKFTWPRGVTVSPVNDSVLVADSSNHRVQIFDCHGHFVSTFGSYGQGDGEFDCLAGVAVNSEGQIIIADRYNHRIQVFDRYGQFSHKFGSEGSADGQLNYPWGIAVDRNGLIYVCDKENHRVQVFQQNGTFVRKFGSLGGNPGQFENPHYVATSYDGKVVVSDSGNHRIQIFSSTGSLVKCFGSEGSEDGQLKFPKGVAVDRQGFIIVADGGNNRVQIFRADGRFLHKFGTWGTGNAQFKGLEGIALTSSGSIVVTDKENHRIQFF